MAIAELQLRRVLETAGEEGRYCGTFDMLDIRLFRHVERLFGKFLELGVPPSTFCFEPRLDRFAQVARDRLHAGARARARDLAAYEGLALFGFPPWAAYGAWTGLAAGILGIMAIWTTVRARRVYSLPGSRVVGFVLTGLAALLLSLFQLFWGLGPF
mgnify:CR=1 FL=1